jgi:aldose 1-epimerase
MSVAVFPFSGIKMSTPKHGEVFKYRLTHSTGAFFSVINYGASITSIFVRDKEGQLADVVLGFCCLDDYLNNSSCHGAIVGRHANRIKNSAFSLNGKECTLPKNDGQNNLHGGSPAFQNVFWDGQVLTQETAQEYLLNSNIQSEYKIEGEAVLFTYRSPDGSCGFPGNLDTSVLYAWTTDMTLLILYRGESDADTLFSPTNHSYFNLQGHDSGNVSRQKLWIDSDTITNKDEGNVPDGTFSNVKGSIFDFTKPTALGPTMTDSNPQLVSSMGLDQNFCLHTTHGKASRAAMLSDPISGRNMEVSTNFPGLQVYTGNHIGGSCGKSGNEYIRFAGVCLEAQLYPDAIHHENFPSPVISANEPRYYVTGYRYFVES